MLVSTVKTEHSSSSCLNCNLLSISLSLSFFLFPFCRGTEPKQLAFSAALGITLGIFPICGVPVFLCGVAIAFLGSACHAPTVMLANIIATPVELALVVPFLRLGEKVTGGPHFPLTSDALKKVFTGQASQEVFLSIGNALLGWLVATPFFFIALYVVLMPCFKILVRKFGAVSSTPKTPTSIDIELNPKPRFA
uniref:DUF2062 domain-containing protein n=1 Tax=Brassica oleracea TaxID=3712 RepID=A0A3P6DEI4_BRAOL|nr:unnamed protein product [Brassica oleracea]